MRALVLDCDGVIAETERDLHRPAFNRAFEEFDLPLRWSPADYGPLLRVAGGKERIASVLRGEAGATPEARGETLRLAAAVHRRKGEIFHELLREAALEP